MYVIEIIGKISTFSLKKSKPGKRGRFHYFRNFSFSFFFKLKSLVQKNKRTVLYLIMKCSVCVGDPLHALKQLERRAH